VRFLIFVWVFSSTAVFAAAPAEVCAEGKVIEPDTQGHCC
jgi:hypothetical protein